MKKDRGDLYQKLGVDSGKGNVREIFSRIIKNDFPGAWVNIVRDPDDPNFVLTGHNDGDGSKFLQRLLHYLETGGDYRVFKGVLDDGLIMNGADICAAGFAYGIWLVTDFLNVALPPKIKEDVMRAIAERAEELMKIFADNDLSLKFFFLGGETADLPNQVRSGVFDVSIAARMRAENVITGKVQPGDIIFGLRSDGMAAWEKRPNSGLMSNGSTLGRSCLMSRQYNRKYPFLAKRTIDFSARPFYKQALPFLWPVESCNFFKGRFKVGDRPEILEGEEISEALMSPTRLWPIFLRQLFDRLRERGLSQDLHGISVNTGGGATKVQHLGDGGVTFVKKMPAPSPLFQLIQEESGEKWKNMYKTFNCGIGLDVVVKQSRAVDDVLFNVAEECKIGIARLGRCEKRTDVRSPKVILATDFGRYEY